MVLTLVLLAACAVFPSGPHPLVSYTRNGSVRFQYTRKSQCIERARTQVDAPAWMNPEEFCSFEAVAEGGAWIGGSREGLGRGVCIAGGLERRLATHLLIERCGRHAEWMHPLRTEGIDLLLRCCVWYQLPGRESAMHLIAKCTTFVVVPDLRCIRMREDMLLHAAAEDTVLGLFP